MSGTVRLPGSKSISNRVLLLAALSEGTTELQDLLDSDDTRVMLAGLKQLGCSISPDAVTPGQAIDVTGIGGQLPAGTAATLFLGNATYSISKTSTTLLAAGTTYNLGFSYDGGGTPAGITLYRNGVAETGTGTTGTSLNALTIRNNQNVQIGEYAIADIGLTTVFNSAKTVIDFRRWATEGGFR